MALLYPGTCLIEGTNLSEGRGTVKPFEQFGAPFINGFELAQAINHLRLPGVIARQASFVPTYQKYNGAQCHGVQLHLTDTSLYEPFQAELKSSNSSLSVTLSISVLPSLQVIIICLISLPVPTPYGKPYETEILHPFSLQVKKQSKAFLKQRSHYLLYS